MTLVRLRSVAPRQRAVRPGTAAPLPGLRRHRRDIEGLRAVAVLLVVAYHCGIPLIGGGFVGVDVFFVISGFLITSLLLRELDDRGTISLTAFYARRMLRLLPAATVVLVVTVAAAAWLLSPLRRNDLLLDALHTTFYGLNYRLAVVGTDYAAGSDPSSLQHFWSLAVEEQFYLLWPLLLLAVGRGTVRRYAVVGAVVAGSFALSVWQTRQNAGWAYFGAHTRAWELGAGALIAVAAPRLPELSRRTAANLGRSGMLAILGAALLYVSGTPFPGSAALLPVAGAAAVLIAGRHHPLPVLVSPPMRAIGRLSYSWYLWHWPFLVLVPAALDLEVSWPGRVLIAGLAFVAATLTFALIESPIRNWPALRDRPRRAIGAGGVTSAVTAMVSLLLTSAAGWTGPTVTYQAVPEPPAREPTQMEQALERAVQLPAVPVNLTPPLAEAAGDQPRPRLDGCDPPATSATVKAPCAYGDRTSRTTVVLFGDSHAGQWFPALEVIARQRQWRLVVITKSACNAAESMVYLDMLKRAYTECVQWRMRAWQRIRQLRPAKVIVSSVSIGDLIGAQDQDAAWADGWARSISRMALPGTDVYYLADTPWQGADVPECLSVHLTAPRRCAVNRASAVTEPRRRELVAESAEVHGATVIDPVPWFCTADTCPVIVGNVLVYKDRHHMTTSYSRMLAPLLSAAIPR